MLLRYVCPLCRGILRVTHIRTVRVTSEIDVMSGWTFGVYEHALEDTQDDLWCTDCLTHFAVRLDAGGYLPSPLAAEDKV
jgi:uncharacterized protein YbaR (Trm112 family)